MSESQISFTKPATMPAAAPPATPAPNPAPNPTSAALAPVTPSLPAAKAATIEMNQSGEIVHVGFDTVPGFEALQRLAKVFANSTLVPDAYKNSIANCCIATEMALRMRCNPLMVMQNLYIVHGNPSWSAKFLIASFNQTGRFSPIRYRWTGQPGAKDRGCVAWAKEKSSGEVVESPLVNWSMVEAEGWSEKKGSKWKTMPDLMFMYRSAAFLVRTTAPELTMGLPTDDESRDAFGTDDAPSLPPAQRRSGAGGIGQLREFALDGIEETLDAGSADAPTP